MMLVLLTTVVVAVLAYVLASLRPVVYSADSVLIVPSGAGGSGPGAFGSGLRTPTGRLRFAWGASPRDSHSRPHQNTAP